MFRFLQLLLLSGLNLVTSTLAKPALAKPALAKSTLAKTICNEDYYGNCIEKGCPTWFDGNHTCDITYDRFKMVNMTCTDIICDPLEPHGPLCIEPDYHLTRSCDLVPNSYLWLLVYPFIYTIPLVGFIITTIHCAPRQKFTTKLTDFDKDLGTTCLTCWCPCLTFGELFQHTYNVPSTIGCLLYFFCGSSKCCLGMVNREKLRQKYNIVEDPCSDCMIDTCIHCWAHPCALCQEKRELDYHRNNIQPEGTTNTLIEPQRPVPSNRQGPSQQSEQPVFMVMASRVDKPIIINASLLDVENGEGNGKENEGSVINIV